MKIYQVSDCHLQIDNTEASTNLARALQQIEGNGDGAILLLTGDLVCNPSVDAYEHFRDIIEAHVSIREIYAIAGNHDDFQMMQAVFNGSRILIKKTVKLVNGCRLIFVDSSKKPLTNMPLGSGRISNKDLSLLKKLSRKTPSIVVVHHPVVDVGTEWFTQIGIENKAAAVRAIHPLTLSVISGHAHSFFKVPVKEGVSQIVCPATCYGFDHANPCYERNEEIGIMSYEIESVGETFDVQGSIIPIKR
jgi:3',5'-cyclic-AMP phosphodiesterase